MSILQRRLVRVAAAAVAVVACVGMLALAPQAYGAVIEANSATEFSGVQGQDGWVYGTYTAFNPSGFAQLSFSGSQWEGTEFLNTPFLDATGGHPGIDTLNWAVRRWVSDVAGQVTISGNLFDRNTGGGDGAHVRIFVNSTEIIQFLNISATSLPYSVLTTLGVGDTVDFVIDPIFDAGSDDTQFTGIIMVSAVPLPAALPLFLSALAGLGLMGWRRRQAGA